MDGQIQALASCICKAFKKSEPLIIENAKYVSLTSWRAMFQDEKEVCAHLPERSEHIKQL